MGRHIEKLQTGFVRVNNKHRNHTDFHDTEFTKCTKGRKMSLFDDLPPTLWTLCRDLGHSLETYLWSQSPANPRSKGTVLLLFTTRDFATQYADTIDEDLIIPIHVATHDLPGMIDRAGRVEAVCLHVHTNARKVFPAEEFLDHAAEVPVALPGIMSW